MNYMAKIGNIAGLSFIISYILYIPYLASLTNYNFITWKKSIPLSVLGTTNQTADLYNMYMIICGILIFTYYGLTMLKGRNLYGKSIYRTLAIISGLLAGIFHASMGIFANRDEIHWIHTLSVVMTVFSLTFAVVFLSIHIHTKHANTLHKLPKIAVIMVIVGLLYPIFVRYSHHKGLWQIILLFIVYFWHILENILYQNKKEMLHDPKYQGINIAKIALFLTIYSGILVLITLATIINPGLTPYHCGSEDVPTLCFPEDSKITWIGGVIGMTISFVIWIKNRN